MARRLHARRGRCPQGACCGGARAGQGRGGSAGGRSASICARRGPDKLDAGPPCRRNRKERGCDDLLVAVIQGVAQKRGYRYRRPRHTLKGRQDANAVDRVGVRLKLRKAQAEAGDIVLLFSDESAALTHPYLARAWARRGADLRVSAPGQSKKVAMMGTLEWAGRKLVVTTSRTKRSTDFRAHLQSLDQRYGPKPGAPLRPVVIVLDNGPIHTSKASRAALAERTHWLTVEWLPKYAPELNDIERVWLDLKANHLAHQTFNDPEDLDRAIHAAVKALNAERNRDPLGNPRISA